MGSGGSAADSCVCSRSADSSLKQTHASSLSSPAGGASSGPKILSKSAIEGFLLEPSASADASEIQTTNEQSKGKTQQTGRECSRYFYKLRSLFSILTAFPFWRAHIWAKVVHTHGWVASSLQGAMYAFVGLGPGSRVPRQCSGA